jgi:hypothetical protein
VFSHKKISQNGDSAQSILHKIPNEKYFLVCGKRHYYLQTNPSSNATYEHNTLSLNAGSRLGSYNANCQTLYDYQPNKKLL